MMEKYSCKNCGASEFTRVGGQLICDYCGSVFQPSQDELPQRETTISISGDVQELLNKMRLDPANAVRYANLILDIDPTNTELMKYL